MTRFRFPSASSSLRALLRAASSHLLGWRGLCCRSASAPSKHRRRTICCGGFLTSRVSSVSQGAGGTPWPKGPKRHPSRRLYQVGVNERDLPTRWYIFIYSGYDASRVRTSHTAQRSARSGSVVSPQGGRGRGPAALHRPDRPGGANANERPSSAGEYLSHRLFSGESRRLRSLEKNRYDHCGSATHVRPIIGASGWDWTSLAHPP